MDLLSAGDPVRDNGINYRARRREPAYGGSELSLTCALCGVVIGICARGVHQD